MSETVLFWKIKDPELIVLNFKGQLQCSMGGKREGPETLELEPSSKRHDGSLEDRNLDEKLRVYKEGAGNNTQVECVTR